MTDLRRAQATLLILLVMPPAVSAQIAGYRELVVETFDAGTEWGVVVGEGKDFVEAELRSFVGIPQYAPPRGDDAVGDPKVLGLKFRAERPSHVSVHLRPAQPIAFGEGTPQVVTAWVQAQNMNHELFTVFSDEFGERLGIAAMGTLNFSGWKEMTAALHAAPRELYFDGFLITATPVELGAGWFYYYFDRVGATVSQW